MVAFFCIGCEGDCITGCLGGELLVDGFDFCSIGIEGGYTDG